MNEPVQNSSAESASDIKALEAEVKRLGELESAEQRLTDAKIAICGSVRTDQRADLNAPATSLPGSPAGNVDAPCYLERSAVRAILIEQDDDHREILEAVLQDIDALPIFTSTEPQPVPTREQIARIVDPGFPLWCKCVEEIDAMPEGRRSDPLRRAQRRENAEGRDAALKKADAILALTRPKPSTGR